MRVDIVRCSFFPVHPAETYLMKNEPLASLRARRTPRRDFCLPPEKCGSQKASRLVALFFVSRKGAAIFLKAAPSLLSKNVFLGELGGLSEAGGSQSFSTLTGQVRLNRMSLFSNEMS